MFGCEIGRDRGPPNRTLYRRGGPVAVEGVEQRLCNIQPVEGATKRSGLGPFQSLGFGGPRKKKLTGLLRRHI